jgi:hypothetical protein
VADRDRAWHLLPLRVRANADAERLPRPGPRLRTRGRREARIVDHPTPLAFALLFEILIYIAQRKPQEVLRTYDELSSLCRTHGIAQEMLWAAPLRARALIELGDTGRGLHDLDAGLTAQTMTRSTLLRPYYLLLFAGALLRVDRHDDAQRALDDASRIAEATSQHAYHSEHARLQGVLLSVRHGPIDAA